MGLMKNVCQISLASGLLLASLPSFAYTINLTVTPEGVTYENGIKIDSMGSGGSVMTTSDWESTEQLTTTKEWQPGLFVGGGNTFTLSNGVELPIKLLGLEYHYGSSGKTTTATPPLLSGTVPSVSSSSGGIYTLYDKSLPSTLMVQNGTHKASEKLVFSDGSSMRPFYFTKPIFYIDENALIQNFSGEVEGQYTGTIPVTYHYFHKPWGTTTFRIMNTNLTVNIYYKPTVLTSITAQDEIALVPIYDVDAQTVKSEPNGFDVKAIGLFQTGIQMTFQDRDYSLQFINNPADPTATSATSIPYSITCQACYNVKRIVVEGKLQNDAMSPVQVHAAAAGDTEIDYFLAVGYENIAADDLDTGNYADTFVVLFEVIL